MKMHYASLFSFYLLVGLGLENNSVVAFSSSNTKKTTTTRMSSIIATTRTTRLSAGGAWLNENMELARDSFPLWTFGAAGSGGIARNVIPKTIDDYLALQKLKDEGTTLGGPTIGLSPLIFYPRDLHKADVDQIVLRTMTVEQMVQKFPVEGNFLAAKGYLTLEAFQKANAKANPLTVRAVFDSFGKPECVEPFLAQQCLDEYRASIISTTTNNNGGDDEYSKLKQNLLYFKLNGFLAIVALLFLLGLADVATATDAYHGWFPDWPGGVDFPSKLFTAEGNPFTIPSYYTWDIPDDYVYQP